MLLHLGYEARGRPGNDLKRDFSLQWAPDGDGVVFSHLGKVVLIDVNSGRARDLVNGGGARLSPLGDKLAFVTPELSAAVLDLTSGKSRVIDPDHATNKRPLEWSPDGRYVTFAETRGSHVPYGCLWAYRVSDGAFVAIPYWGIGGPVYGVSLNEVWPSSTGH